jgi:hypothetical protein
MNNEVPMIDNYLDRDYNYSNEEEILDYDEE